MSFPFQVKGSLYSLLMEIAEVKYKVVEEGIEEEQLQVDTEHLWDKEPYIIITSQDDQKGRESLERLEKESPRFLRKS